MDSLHPMAGRGAGIRGRPTAGASPIFTIQFHRHPHNVELISRFARPGAVPPARAISSHSQLALDDATKNTPHRLGSQERATRGVNRALPSSRGFSRPWFTKRRSWLGKQFGIANRPTADFSSQRVSSDGVGSIASIVLRRRGDPGSVHVHHPARRSLRASALWLLGPRARRSWGIFRSILSTL